MITQIIGTNRPGSKSALLARYLNQCYADLGETIEVIDLAELPADIFNPAAYANKPEAFKPMVNKVLASDGLLIVTPEYNGGLPGVLKYFIDMLPFPESFEHRPVAFIGLAAGRWGGLLPVQQLQQIFSYRNAYIYPKKVYLPGVHNVLNEQGEVIDDAIQNQLKKQVEGFIDFVKQFSL